VRALRASDVVSLGAGHALPGDVVDITKVPQSRVQVELEDARQVERLSARCGKEKSRSAADNIALQQVCNGRA